MNCKQGDLAVVIVPGRWHGVLVSVLHAAPVGEDFRLPDGFLQSPCEPGMWVVEVLGSPVEVKVNGPLGHRLTRFGATSDSNLRPIRDPGDGARDETLNWLPLPHKETA